MNPNTSKLPLFIAAAIVAFLVLASLNPFVIIKSGERGVVSTFGKVSPNIMNEGLNFRIPGIQEVVIYPTQTQTTNVSTSAYSSDLQQMNISVKVLYRLNPDQLYDLVVKYRGNIINDFLKPRVLNTLKDTASKYRAEEFVKSRAEAKAALLIQLEKDLEGIINIKDIAITEIDLSDKLEQAIEEKQVQEQLALQKKYELQKERIQAEIKVVKANAEAQAIKIKASAITQNPKIIQLEAVKKWDGKMPNTYVSGKTQTFLPLQ